MKRTLTAPRMLGPNAIAFDSAGNAYVASSGGGPSEIPSAVYVYQPGATESYKAIIEAVDVPERLAFDGSGNLYVANLGLANPPSIAVFSPGSSSPSHVIYNGIDDPVSLSFDSHGDLFVANHAGFKRDRGAVTVYAPNTTDPKLVIEKGVDRPNQALLDRSDNLYVGNGDGGVSVYKAGRSWPSRILDRRHGVDAIALDGRDYLYEVSGYIAVYRPGKTRPYKVVNNKGSFSVAFDEQYDLFVGDNPRGCGKAGKRRNDGCVRVFQRGTLVFMYQVNDPDTPYALAFGPP